MISALSDARQGDVLLLHGCCHNPTGTQFSREQWRAISALCNERGVIPFIDLAYQGLGDGMEEDAWGTRLILDTVPDVLLAYSCDKNFAMYRDRVGALFVQAGSAAMLNLAKANALTIARSLWSMPPDHGAAVVGTILDDPDLRAAWQDELTGMRQRLRRCGRSWRRPTRSGSCGPAARSVFPTSHRPRCGRRRKAYARHLHAG
jgi:aromatic-amino-acid transaminase